MRRLVVVHLPLLITCYLLVITSHFAGHQVTCLKSHKLSSASGELDDVRAPESHGPHGTLSGKTSLEAATQPPQFIIGKIDEVAKELTIIVKEGAADQESAPPVTKQANGGKQATVQSKSGDTNAGHANGPEGPSRPDSREGEALPSPRTDIAASFRLDETTKVISVGRHKNESGILWGATNTGGRRDNNNETSAQKPSFLDENHGNVATNYSVYLVSRSREHIAILIDVVDIDFEPMLNCEHQEIKFSIVGEISKQLLKKKNVTSSGSSGGEADGADSQQPQVDSATGGKSDGEPDGGMPIVIREDEEEGEEQKQQELEGGEDLFSQTSDTPGPPPLPVSEAMAVLLNAPLNKTILDDSDELNDFKLIDTTIDYLYDETCREIREVSMQHRTSASSHSETTNREQQQQQQQQQHQQQQQQQPKSKLHQRRRKHKSSKSKRGKRKQKGLKCNHQETRFKDLFASKLDTHLEWDDFKIVCGHIKQLVIPMRSLRLTISSDEFAAKSTFSLRYQFISDPRLLPAHDNGKYFCRNRNVIDVSLKCDGYDDCGDASDESVKLCSYPSGGQQSSSGQGEVDESQSTTRAKSRPHAHSKSGSSSSKHSHLPGSQKRNKLVFFNGDIKHCCQSADWQNAIAASSGSGQGAPQEQMLNLQTLIGESMKLFTGPLFAPTNGDGGGGGARRSRRVKRIVGGSEAHRGSWPGQVSLQYELLEPVCHFCAGTLIHPLYVLTAGHCITKEAFSRGVKVVLGAHDLRYLNGTSIQTRYVEDAQIYPGVDVKHLSFDWENDMNNDIALVRLNAPVQITPQVAPACLPPFNTPLGVNTTCRSIGWGQTHGSGGSNVLKYLPLRVADGSECTKQLIDRDPDMKTENSKVTQRKLRGASYSPTTLTDTYNNQTMICVSSSQGHGICQGDSGGPLYCDRITTSGEHCTEVYGVASFIIQYATVSAMCGVENLPGIFGEVSSKSEWISATIKMFEQMYRLRYGPK